MTSCNATFIVNDFLLSRLLGIEENELGTAYVFNERIEEAFRRILEDDESTMSTKIGSIDSVERDSHSSFVSVMMECEDGKALEDRLRTSCGRRPDAFELLLFTQSEHSENDARRQALDSFIDEGLSYLPLDDEEQRKVDEPVVRHRLRSWLMDEMRSVMDYGIREALQEAGEE